MDKKVLIAIVISLAIIMLYPYFLDRFFPQEEVVKAPPADDAVVRVAEAPEAPSVSGAESATGKAAAPAAPAKPRPTIKEVLTTVDTPLFRAVFSNIGGSVKSWELKNYRSEKEKDAPLIDLAETITTDNTFTTLISNGLREIVVFTPSATDVKLDGADTATLVLNGRTSEGINVVKTYNFDASSYKFTTSLKVSNPTEKLVSAFVETTMGSVYGSKDSYGYHTGPVVKSNQEVKRFVADDNTATGTGVTDWFGMEDKYFLAVMLPTGSEGLSWRIDVQSETSSRSLMKMPLGLAPGGESVFEFASYVGPKQYSLLKKDKHGLAESIEFGWFSFLAKPLLVALTFFQGFVVNYGLAIIILTIIIKIVFYPLTKQSMKSMKDMQKLQPQMAILKEKYKDDKQTLNKEMMELYKRNKINPIGGCLPMVLQIPVFIGLYEALYVAIELRHAPFALWITDLSAKDPYYITPIVMGGSMFLQQKMSPTSMDPTQSKLMMLMPAIFTFMFLNFPSGLVIYWLVNNILTIGQQYLIQRSPSGPSTPAPKMKKAKA